MRIAIKSSLPLLSTLLLLPGVASAQTVPPLWDRSAEYTDISGLPAGSMLGNPAPDSVGNLVWNYEWLQNSCCTGPAWAQYPKDGAKPMEVDPDFWGGSPHWVAGQDTGCAIDAYSMLDVYYQTFTNPGPIFFKPYVRWENTTGQSFNLDIVGKLRVNWTGVAGSIQATDVDVAIVFLDASAGNAKTPLYLNTVSKPTPASLLDESLTLPPINILGVPIDPGDSILLSGAAITPTGSNNYVYLIDIGLRYVVGNSVLATETVRLGVPPNPLALMPGIKNRPVVGKKWDPFIDHTTFFPGAIVDFLFLSLTPVNVVLAPYGTLLCSPPYLLIKSKPAGVPLAISIPLDASLYGLSLCAQGSSFDGVDVEFTNALDITIGSH